MEGHIHIQRPGDNEVIRQYIESFRKDTDQELIDDFAKQKKCGITGVHQQALYLIALRIVMKERFGESGIEIVDNILIRFK